MCIDFLLWQFIAVSLHLFFLSFIIYITYTTVHIRLVPIYFSTLFPIIIIMNKVKINYGPRSRGYEGAKNLPLVDLSPPLSQEGEVLGVMWSPPQTHILCCLCLGCPLPHSLINLILFFLTSDAFHLTFLLWNTIYRFLNLIFWL